MLHDFDQFFEMYKKNNFGQKRGVRGVISLKQHLEILQDIHQIQAFRSPGHVQLSDFTEMKMTFEESCAWLDKYDDLICYIFRVRKSWYVTRPNPRSLCPLRFPRWWPRRRWRGRRRSGCTPCNRRPTWRRRFLVWSGRGGWWAAPPPPTAATRSTGSGATAEAESSQRRYELHSVFFICRIFFD